MKKESQQDSSSSKTQTKYLYFSYLKQTGVYDLVQDALKQTALQRPADPVRFVAALLQ
jgi:hypothetical protein